jgi:predicted nucleotidyltransferase
MGKEKIIDAVRKYSDLVVQKYPVKMIVLFGSYARGNAWELSDIDIAVVLDKVEGDFFTEWGKLTMLAIGINSLIEPLLIEDSEAEPSGFLEEILKYGEVIYRKAS